MGESVDLIKEFKDAKPPEKVVIVVGVLAVIGVAFYLYQKGMSSSQAASSTGAPTSQTAGYPMAGNLPVVPWGTNPLYDPNGNQTGWQTGPPPGTQPPQPSPGPFTWPSALANMKIWQGTSSHNYFFGPNGPQQDKVGQTLLSTLFPQGTTFSGSTGGFLSYTLPGSTTPVVTQVKLVNPLPPPEMMVANTSVAKTAASIKH